MKTDAFHLLVVDKEDASKRKPAETAQARRLRQNDTEEEYRLWGKLRARRLNGWKLTRQIPLGVYVVDFLCRERRLIVEIDGFQHAENPRDIARTKWLKGRMPNRPTQPETLDTRRNIATSLFCPTGRRCRKADEGAAPTANSNRSRIIEQTPHTQTSGFT